MVTGSSVHAYSRCSHHARLTSRTVVILDVVHIPLLLVWSHLENLNTENTLHYDTKQRFPSLSFITTMCMCTCVHVLNAVSKLADLFWERSISFPQCAVWSIGICIQKTYFNHRYYKHVTVTLRVYNMYALT